ncbi:hypothetical protein R3W88_002143 [Solanum pinnatisectum]|uniref:Uncharacterized protein n=1 Tax=Solanum pinnatisectum TaxID=50273 RepID=A0AAV9MK85_9SOLN|nr:hypothetical protein R3W88_002143 [Solanum pinnatisectum]
MYNLHNFLYNNPLLCSYSKVPLLYRLARKLNQEGGNSPGAVSLDDVDLDQVSLDFFLNCARKGELLELSEAIRDYHDNTLFPHILLFVNVPVPEVYLLQHRIIPYGRLPVPISTSPILRTLSMSESIDTEPFEELSSLSKSQSLSSTQQQELTVDNIEDFDDDDDLDEVDSRRYSRRVLNDAADLVLGLPSFATAIGDHDLHETAYEILLAAAGPSGFLEAMDVRTRLGLLNAMVGKVGKRMDTILIPHMFLFLLLQQRCKGQCLKSLREIAMPLAERPVRGDLTGEVCHWADGYHLNVKLYENLLLSVFDVLDEGKLTEEVKEILELLKSTWRNLGITETIHYTCYAWVLFRQLKKIPLKEQMELQERMHLKSLRSRVEMEKGFQELTFLLSFLLPISKWADKQLGDYHLDYAEEVSCPGFVWISWLLLESELVWKRSLSPLLVLSPFAARNKVNNLSSFLSTLNSLCWSGVFFFCGFEMSLRDVFSLSYPLHLIFLK